MSRRQIRAERSAAEARKHFSLLPSEDEDGDVSSDDEIFDTFGGCVVDGDVTGRTAPTAKETP